MMLEWFKFRLSWVNAFKMLPKPEADSLLDAICAYVNDDPLPELIGAASLVWALILPELRKDAEQREKVSNSRSECGKLGGRPKKQKVDEEPEAFEEKQKNQMLSEKANESKKSHIRDKNKEIRDKNKENISPLKPPKGDAPGFDAFWAVYPRKDSKATAVKAWNKLNPDEKLQEQIRAAVTVQAFSSKWREDGGKYIPYAATYLNGRRWEDEGVKVDGTQSGNDHEQDEGYSFLRTEVQTL